jgi:hypothetical protein
VATEPSLPGSAPELIPLEKLAENGFSLPTNVSSNVILLQAAFSTNSLDAGMPDGEVIRIVGPRLRMLISMAVRQVSFKHLSNIFLPETTIR